MRAHTRRAARTAQLARTAGGKEQRDRGHVGLLIGVLAMVLILALGDRWVPSAGSLS